MVKDLVRLPESAGVTVCQLKKKVPKKRKPVDLRRLGSTWVDLGWPNPG